MESLYKPSEKLGLPPGSLIHVGEVLETAGNLSVIDYSREKIEEEVIQSVEELAKYKDTDSVTWITVEGLQNVSIIERIGEIFGIHQLVLEDILNTNQRPKFEEYDDYLYIVIKCLLPEVEPFTVNYEQVSIVLIKNCVIIFKEKQDNLLDPVEQRIRTSSGKFRSLGPDYLAYAILDFIVDQNFIVLDALDESINTLEESLLTGVPTKAMLYKIQRLKREIIVIRRYVSPVRELLFAMIRSESSLIHETTHIFLRDVSDHAMRVIESIESYRDILTGLLDIYVSSVSNKMNEVMTVLTVLTSIFIPLTFISGVYGMNFDYMPELRWRWAYPVIWCVFISMVISMLLLFKKKKWL